MNVPGLEPRYRWRYSKDIFYIVNRTVELHNFGFTRRGLSLSECRKRLPKYNRKKKSAH